MKFVDKLLGLLSSGFDVLGGLLNRLITFLQKPFTYLYYFLDGVFYFFYQLFMIVVKVVTLFVALVQFFGALVLGFMRSIGELLTVNFNAPVTYPGASQEGINVVLDLFGKMGMMTVVPLILLAVLWGYFIKKIIGLLGGELRSDA
jgi:hypothetical protein